RKPSDADRGASSFTSPMKGLGGRGDVAQQFGGGLQIPIRIGNVRVAEIRAQGCHVSRDRSAITWALLQRPHSERVSEIVKPTARLAKTAAQTGRSGQNEKGCDDGGIGKLGPVPGDKEGGCGWSKPAAGG